MSTLSGAGNLVLIGMPGSGKSTVGVLAAKALGMDFVDTDLLLQKQEGLLLNEILVRHGAAGFLSVENELLAGLKVDAAVLATGGSAVYHERGMNHLKLKGTVVWLDVPFNEIERRLGDLGKRGVVLARGQSLRELHDERLPLYKRWADLKLEVRNELLDTTVKRLVELVRR